MLPTLIIHVGPHKTGTTSVQDSLASQRERLARDGILYPPSVPGAHFAGQHSDLAFRLREAGTESCREYFSSIRTQARRRHCPYVILSGEEFSAVSLQPMLLDLIQHLRAEWVVRLVYVRRNLHDLAYSNLVQHLTGEIGHLFEWHYDVAAWSRQFAVRNAMREAFFESQSAMFVDLHESGGAGLASSVVEAGTGKRLAYLVAHHENSAAAKLGERPDLLLSYPLRVILGMLYGEPNTSPRCYAEAQAVLGTNGVDPDAYAHLVDRLKHHFRTQIAEGLKS